MRDIPVGNGSLLVNFDDKYQIRDIYFPHVGQENHTEGYPSRFGVWVDGEFSWIASDDWTHELRYLPETLVTDVTVVNEELGLRIVSNDTVASHDNIFLRRIRIENLKDEERDVRVFLHQDFRIYENKFGDTAYYDPDAESLIHYKKHRYFLINTEPHFTTFATGRKAFHEKEGTWRDAEDGELQGAPVTEGSVDSTIGVEFQLRKSGSYEFFYWIAVGTTRDEVASLNSHILERRPQVYLDYTANYWRAWVNKNDRDMAALKPEIIDFYKRSLLIIHTQIDYRGAILAANDSDVTERATDNYSYLWTRDGSFVANALDKAGYPGVTRAFFDLCSRIVHKDGYFCQKYNPDGSVASGWLASWDAATRQKLLPIQEDETALVLWALWQHYDRYRDIEFAHRVYRVLTVHCAEFIADFRDEVLKLPKPSWNLWEDRSGIHTFTCSAVVAGLRAAAKFARLFAEVERATRYEAVADEIVAAMRQHLYSNESGRFCRSLELRNGKFEMDMTIDASLFGIFYFGCFDTGNEMVVNTVKAVADALSIRSDIGGVARFQDDGYVRASPKATGNPWFICTMWLAEYYLESAQTENDLAPVVDALDWTVQRALPSGVLAEQIDPFSGEPLSVSPLTWSHATYVAMVNSYLAKLSSLRPMR